MIHNIVFDMGNVLMRWDPIYLARCEAVPEEDLDLFVREVFTGREWSALDHGTMTEEEAYESIRPRLPERLWPAAEHLVLDWWRHPILPVAGVAEIVRELKQSGYHIYLLSNASTHLRDYFDRIPGSECFDALLVSAECRQIKPCREIYETLFEQFRLIPEECLFIDDSNNNVEMSVTCGMSAIVFYQDPARLRRELQAYGVRIST